MERGKMSFRLIDFTKDDLYDVGIPAIEEQNQNVSLFLDFEKKTKHEIGHTLPLEKHRKYDRRYQSSTYIHIH